MGEMMIQMEIVLQEEIGGKGHSITKALPPRHVNSPCSLCKKYAYDLRVPEYALRLPFLGNSVSISQNPLAKTLGFVKSGRALT
ncbi:hypothetical protein HHK36_019773 [Tetracentron sinense]|uniref:Uncharacterized protein n=1 Tax=Tetracentron sinense TaxID=13715 RepID=A0A834YUD0_TETSI|nr:hypothetical protein HHK36_019773 [Tetracentron sinense]